MPGTLPTRLPVGTGRFGGTQAAHANNLAAAKGKGHKGGPT
jgi:hypothetical protein